jgi:hypothetical protein
MPRVITKINTTIKPIRVSSIIDPPLLELYAKYHISDDKSIITFGIIVGCQDGAIILKMAF